MPLKKDIVPWEFDENFHDAAEKMQISRHVKQTVEYIDLFSPTTVLQTFQPLLTALHASENHRHVALFARKLDFFLEHISLLETGLMPHFKKQ